MARTQSFRDEWIFVRGHCHYVTDAKWFKKGFRRLLGGATADGLEVTAVGDVDLSVCVLQSLHSVSSTLVLRNVLCVPAMLCNGLNYESLFDRVEVEKGEIRCLDASGEIQCHGLHVGGAFKLQRQDPNGCHICINRDDFTSLFLSDKERAQLFGPTALYPFDQPFDAEKEEA